MSEGRQLLRPATIIVLIMLTGTLGFMVNVDALKGKPVVTYPLPSGLVQDNGEWFYEEFAGGQGVTSLGLKADAAASGASAP